MATCYLDKDLETMNKSELEGALMTIDEVRSQITWRIHVIESGIVPTCAECGEVLEEWLCPI